ncbi:MAG: hypothetical protein S4CHLAM2_13490 [Chlamydiales bacterium]|nr:hypothetical protein [Chlamydiales bacterium]
MMITLVIDTSHERSLVAFADGFDLLLTVPLPVGLQSSKHLFPAIHTGFQKLKLTAHNLKKIVVAVGPGSFTGIRVGVAAAKGIAAPLDIPLFGACSLYGFEGEDIFASVMDARIGGAFVWREGLEPSLVTLEELPEALAGCEMVVGPQLARIPFPNKVERDPNPLALIKKALPGKEGDLDLIYLRETI